MRPKNCRHCGEPLIESEKGVCTTCEQDRKSSHDKGGSFFHIGVQQPRNTCACGQILDPFYTECNNCKNARLEQEKYNK